MIRVADVGSRNVGNENTLFHFRTARPPGRSFRKSDAFGVEVGYLAASRVSSTLNRRHGVSVHVENHCSKSGCFLDAYLLCRMLLVCQGEGMLAVAVGGGLLQPG